VRNYPQKFMDIGAGSAGTIEPTQSTSV